MVLSEKPEAKQWQIPFYYHQSCGRAVWRLLSLKNTLRIWEVFYTAIPSVFGMIKAFSSISLQISSSASSGPDDEYLGNKSLLALLKHFIAELAVPYWWNLTAIFFIYCLLCYLLIYLFIMIGPSWIFGIIGTCMDFLPEPEDIFPLHSTSPKPLRALFAHEWWHGWHNLLKAHFS